MYFILYIDLILFLLQQQIYSASDEIRPLPCDTYFDSLWICTISLRLNGLPVSKVELDSTDRRLLKGSHMLWASR